MTWTMPLRRTILHFSQRTLTDACTFMLPFRPPATGQQTAPARDSPTTYCTTRDPSLSNSLLQPVSDPPPGQIVRRQLDCHPIPGQDLDEVKPQLARDVTQ